jgi:voltage-gated potassium channel Kch
MLSNLFLGTMMIAVTVLVHTTGLVLLTRAITRGVRVLRLHRHPVGKMSAVTMTVLGLFLLHTIEVWMWALLFLAVGIAAGLEPALYFSTVTFSTIGYGDIVPPQQWRLLAALEGINGFLLIGWSTAYLVAASTRHGPFRMGEHF